MPFLDFSLAASGHAFKTILSDSNDAPFPQMMWSGVLSISSLCLMAKGLINDLMTSSPNSNSRALWRGQQRYQLNSKIRSMSLGFC
mmetsp:Transcript_6113/g.9302  ORF Transcript_6113/g.9302 Transcript_6113/m.9302 type:complete len:86 (-) Transcript_6113:170-427(-)